ncbi:hypothetical protein LZ198_38515 [Myxococcus sp. K15C18031901]|uniref:SitA5 family polymorphic toxin n=1 Tax=Myxococcus dinghuensis TaxID=2906761 RepID=UPI0020A73223|nr:hypothetical protein [Myxococcus dinghuensis]MCP3104776.1 hypothetical protein [Myxococcus dinghuensis]
MDDDDFEDAMAKLAQDVRPASSPRLFAHRLLSNAPWDNPRAVPSKRLRLASTTAEENPARRQGHSPPSAAEAELVNAYGAWCKSKGTPGDCLRLLGPDISLGEDGRRTLALSIALDSVWDETAEALEDMADPVAVQATIAISMAVYLSLWVLPEPLSKGAAAVLTASLIAWLGVDAVVGLIRGWIRLSDETRVATTFGEVSAAGERYGEILGVNTARAFVMLTTAAIGSTLGLAAKTPSLPGYAQASQMAAQQGGFNLAAVGQVGAVAISAEGALIIAVAPDAVAMSATQPPGRGNPHSGMGTPQPPEEAPTTPSSPPDPTATPSGHRPRISPDDDQATVRSLTRENESAELLAKAGFKVEQRPQVTGTTRRPDFRIEERIFDNYAPSTSNPRSIWSVINDTKVNPPSKSMQADRIVLNLRDSGVDLSALRRQFLDWPMPRLKEVLVVTREGTILSLWP